MFCEKGVLRNFAKFTGKNLCQSLLFSRVAGLRLVTLLKKRLWHMCFPVNFTKFLRTPFIIEHLWWLLPTDGSLFFQLISSTNSITLPRHQGVWWQPNNVSFESEKCRGIALKKKIKSA